MTGTRDNAQWPLYICCFGSMASMRMCDSMLPVLATAFAVGADRAAQTIASFALAYGICQLGSGPLGDRLGKMRVIALAAVVCALGNLGACLAGNLDELLAARFFSGAAAAGIVPLTMAWIGDHSADGERQAALARLLGATVLGMIAGQWGGAALASSWGWRTPFASIAAVFALGWLAVRSVSPPIARDTQAKQPAFARRTIGMLGASRVRIVLLVTFVEGAFAYSALAFLPTYLNTSFGLSSSTAGLIASSYGVGGLLFSLSSKRVIRRFRDARLAQVGGLLLAISLVALAVSPFWWLSVPACMLAGFGFYALHNVLQNHAAQMAPQARGTAVSLFSCVLFLGQSFGIALAARSLAHASVRILFAVCAVGLLVLALVFAHLSTPRRAPQTSRVPE
ncbi:putative MFS family arabinose efflux permease [Paraburkholderia terricola]|uniref:MFS transporter n=1 Tax=Paraburkholderia terricola TaxID=169427 RepID=UPI00285E0FCF|nr:MFS transporter [Paraburkholderia terricola]MDR6447807.1 putative MFS family arabinose efflux permease [Paraburkholderia terricola]